MEEIVDKKSLLNTLHSLYFGEAKTYMHYCDCLDIMAKDGKHISQDKLDTKHEMKGRCDALANTIRFIEEEYDYTTNN
jgi:hypothetical protein